jgi:hypothetical protein
MAGVRTQKGRVTELKGLKNREVKELKSFRFSTLRLFNFLDCSGPML